ncbi:MAG: 2-C-methyl-D-erythritol 4-phosphate cytidylyltransferase [Erysipelotrichaceae bacterium]|nr:2-C-methyl-D-erythritol 4-phosphate cytidylyltransferase [Erysipelotrichaceae bacterium]
MKYSVILLAAGKGTRTHLDYNKVLYRFKDGQTVLSRCLKTFSDDPDCIQIIVVCADYEMEKIAEDCSRWDKACFVTGGDTRQDSVWNGLQKADQEVVLIHDAARPFLRRENLEDLKKCLEQEDAALLMVPAVDTVKIVNEQGYVEFSPKRNLVYHAQTPQGFKTDVIREAHRKGRAAGFAATDDAQLVEQFTDVPVACVQGDLSNKKITHPGDLEFDS